MTVMPNQSPEPTADCGFSSAFAVDTLGDVVQLWSLGHMRHFFSLFLLVLLTGCDPGYGIYRSTRVSFMPAPAVVGAAVRETPGVDDVRYSYAESGRPLTWSGIKPPDQVHTFSYHGGSDVRGSLMFVVDYKGTVEYSQSLMMLGRQPPQEWIDATHPVMLEIESRLEHDCGLTNLSRTVKETLDGVKLR